MSNEFKEFCVEKGIQMQYTVAYNPELNGVAERMNRTLLDCARTMILHCKTLGKEFWGEAVLTAVHLINRSPTSCLSVTPYEMWHGKRPNVSYFRVFGAVAYAHVPQQIRKKLDAKGRKLIMVGYSPSGYRLWDEENNRVVEGRNVVFDEAFNNSNECENQNLDTEVELEIQGQPQEEIEHTEITEQRGSNDEGGHRTRTRQIKKPQRLNDYVTDFEEEEDDALFALQIQSEEDVPTNFEELETRNDRTLWEQAVHEELKSLEENQTWEIVDKPKEGKLIDTKWVFTKKNINGAEIYKARLVARGFLQSGLEDADIYSPVARLETLRILLSIAVQRDYFICQMDVKSAFLYGEIKELVHLTPPAGIKVDSCKVLKLKKSLYGLRKSPKYWYEKFNKSITDYGFIRSVNDYCLFSKDNLYILLYVDDLLIFSTDLVQIDKLKRFLCVHFKMKDLGYNHLKYLGISINKNGNDLYINQSEYLKSVLKRFNMLDCRSVDTPMDTNFKMQENYNINPALENLCRSCIGSLMYATLGSRPDLASSVYYLSRFQDKPSDDLWVALKRILRYIKGSLNVKLKYSKSESSSPLIGFADADFARDFDRKSTSGYVFKVFGNTVTWKSKKQSVVALSTTEAEYISLCEATVQALWLKKILFDLGIDCVSVTIFEDNQSTIKSAYNPEQKRLKHMDVKYNFVKQEIEKKTINVVFVETKNQLADILTKPLGKVLFSSFVKRLGLI
ncbi:unnamed protein product [Callosobruchus maculatus]|uniref:Integrase catalytic domain-containing protein n=1 Tax=Callosobruchus maculatus TaxID=64391 RepID=A0A653BYV4_CALMS|nr:unnamed protein product [Callosobruchus maculatus]